MLPRLVASARDLLPDGAGKVCARDVTLYTMQVQSGSVCNIDLLNLLLRHRRFALVLVRDVDFEGMALLRTPTRVDVRVVEPCGIMGR